MFEKKTVKFEKNGQSIRIEIYLQNMQRWYKKMNFSSGGLSSLHFHPFRDRLSKSPSSWMNDLEQWNSVFQGQYIAGVGKVTSDKRSTSHGGASKFMEPWYVVPEKWNDSLISAGGALTLLKIEPVLLEKVTACCHMR